MAPAEEEHTWEKWLALQLQQRDREGSSAESVGDEDTAEVFVEAQLEVFEIAFCRQAGRVEVLSASAMP